MMDKEVIKALEDMKRQIDDEEWVVYTNDRGSGSAGVDYVNDAGVIDNYLRFAKTGDNKSVPHCNDIYYISSSDFDEEDNEVVNEILEHFGDSVEREEILGLVVCSEYYDMSFTFYMLHIKG